MRLSRTQLFPVTALVVAMALCAQPPGPSAAGKGKGKGATTDAAAPADGKGTEGKGNGKGAGPAAAKAPTPPPIPQVLRLVRPKLYLVTGHGANVLFKATPAGVILVDTKLSAEDNPGQSNFDRLIELIHGITDQPVKAVYNTNHHQDQAGNNDKFLALGAPVIGPDHLKASLVNYSVTPKPAPPSVTFGSTHTTKIGGSEVRAYHYGPGSTGGDTVVLFVPEKLLAIGELVTVNRAPVIDYAGGGSLVGWVKFLDEILKLDWTLAVPGAGEPVDRVFVERYRKNLQTLIDGVKAAISRGATKEQVLALAKSDDLGWSLQFDPIGLNAFYGEMASAK